MSASTQHLVKNLFAALGLEIPEERSETFPRANMKGALHQHSSLGFKPRTVIDGGVATQTLELYEEFSGATILLIEPFLRKARFAEQAKELS
jgi:hypothetical protein